MDNFNIKDFLLHHINILLPFSVDNRSEIVNLILDVSILAEADAVNGLLHWKEFAGLNCINVLNSRQYCIFLAYLARRLYLDGCKRESDLIACINKMLNGCEIFGHIDLPRSLSIGHTIGVVIGRARIGNDLFIQHNSTIGAWKNEAPRLGNRVMIFNGALIAGNSIIGDNSVIGPGVRVVNNNVPCNTIVFQGAGAELIFKSNKHNLIDSFLA